DRRITTGSTGTQVHRPDELESGRIHRPPFGPGNADHAVLERLAQRLEGWAHELRELVEEQHASVGETELARARRPAAPDDRGHGGAVVGRPQWRVAHQRTLGREQPGDGV